MQIETADFITQHGAGKQSFEFKPGRLNLLISEEEQQKSDLFSAISLVLWGKGDGNGNGNGALKEGSVKLELDGKTVVLKRDFESNELMLDAESEANAEQILAGISKDMFNTLFLVGQDEGGSKHLADRGTRLNLLGQYASKSEHHSNIDKAVKLVEEKLEKYPFKGKTYKIDDLIAGLNRGKVVLEERLQQLEREREESGTLMEELKRLEWEQEKSKRTQKREEYFQLCLETAELDARIMKVQQRLLHQAELKREISQLGELADFPISGQRKVQDLWTTRQARLADLQRHDEELEKSIKTLQVEEESLTEKNDELDQFTIEDSQQLYGLAKTIASAQEEIEQLQQEQALEMRRVKESGVNFDDISLVRKAVLAINPADLEETHRIADELKYQKDKLQILVEQSQDTGKQLKVLDEEITLFDIKTRKFRNVIVCLLIIFVGIWLFSFFKEFEVLGTIFFTSFVLSGIALLSLPLLLSSIRKQFEEKVESIRQQQSGFDSNELKISDKISKIQEEGDRIAKQYDMESAAELFKKLQIYSTHAGRLKQLDILEQMLATREQQLSNLNKEGMSFFKKVNRKSSIITPSAIYVLASEILWHRESTRKLDKFTAVVNHRKQERKFIEGEVADLDSVLQDHFTKARLPNPEKIEASFEAYEQKCKDYYKLESLRQDLERMEKDVVTSDIYERDLPTLLNKLQHRRTDAWNFMQDLIGKYPDILSETLDDDEIGRMALSEIQVMQEQMQARDERLVELHSLIRSAVKNFDEFHPKTMHELEILERDLQAIKHHKEALSLARDSLMQVAKESKTSWSQELAEISEDMLSGMDLDVKKIDWDDNLEMTLTIRDQSEPIHERDLERKVPRGLRQQINWIMRMMLCRYIAHRLPLPVVLDEPFCDLDDKRFSSCMDLLIRKILPHCQLIVLTCQQVRHKWFVDKLPKAEKSKISFIS